MPNLDPRLQPFRSDIAAAHLRGLVPAPLFVAGTRKSVGRGLLSIRKSPLSDAEQVNELRYGESFTVYEEKNGWAWGQAGRDDYVGYVEAQFLVAETEAPTHHIKTASTFFFAAPSVKAPVRARLTYLSPIALTGKTEGRFSEIMGGGFVFTEHVVPITEPLERDVVTAAGRFLGAPYLWGGVSPLGCDCSGLVQAAFAATGRKAPRDSDMQAKEVGEALSPAADGTYAYHRGDIVFFPGHVGLMADESALLHANAYHGRVVVEPLADVVARGSAITVVRRL